MATDETLPAYPGDILQDSQGLLYLASETHRWGTGAVLRWREGDQVRESYHRIRPGQAVVVGQARTMPEDVAAARRDAMGTAKLIATERGEPFLPNAVAVLMHLMAATDRDADAEISAAYDRAEAWLREAGYAA